jgi:hypothetical protein
MSLRRTGWLLLIWLGLAGRPRADAALSLDVTALPVAPGEMSEMMAETEAIWRPYGIAFAWATSKAAATFIDADDWLTVLPGQGAREESRMSNGRRLGAVVFSEGRVLAGNIVYLSVDAVTAIVDGTRVADRAIGTGPPSWRARLRGRAFGRVLAHELGHYLLAWRAHTPGDLLRARFDARLLVDSGREGLTVSPLLLPRLRARLAALSRTTPSLAEHGNGAARN